MSSVLDYYKEYHKSGGQYSLENMKGSSRHLMIGNWLINHVKEGGRVLDIGCGDGSYSEWLPQFSWTGIDINEEKTKYNGNRLVHDIENTPYAGTAGSYDAVICSEVLEHLFSPEKIHAEAHRLLKPRGVYVISTPNYNWVEHVYGGFKQILYSPGGGHLKEHIRYFTPETHKEMLDKAGFQSIEFMGADIHFGTFFQEARAYLGGALPERTQGEVDWMIGHMFRCVSHTIGILAVKI